MSIVVFLGPSLKLADAQALLPNAMFLPPACMGDVLTAVHRGATVIGIIDGLFDQVLSVWHKEVLFALSRGVHVFGSSSMGALRAAELHPFGMVGVGQIFDAFSKGELEDDDEVAVAHGTTEGGYRPHSEAMVNLRAGLRRALTRGLITEAEHDVLVRGAKALFYPERSWAAIRDIGLASGLPRERVDALVSDMRQDPLDIKRQDALMLLKHIAAFVADHHEPHRPRFDFEPTVFWDGLVKSFRDGIRRSDGAMIEHSEPVDDEALIRHAQLRDGRALSRAALGLWLCEREAERSGAMVDAATWRATAVRFRRERGLLSAADLTRWMRRHSVTEEDFGRLVHREALLDLLGRRHSTEVRERLLDVLKDRGELGRLRDEAQRRSKLLREGGATSPLSEAELVAWFTKKAGPFETNAPLWEHLGFSDAEAFRQELVILHALDRGVI